MKKKMKEKAEQTEIQSGSDNEFDSKANAEMALSGPQPLSRSQCEQTARTWNEGTNTCD